MQDVSGNDAFKSDGPFNFARAVFGLGGGKYMDVASPHRYAQSHYIPWTWASWGNASFLLPNETSGDGSPGMVRASDI